ncbi:ribosomal protein L7Ae, putative [Trichomonas vaginalis G3]|uniref:H/ACA ribonucleoprotein complex subunit 2 n=1 Tax=Trichomonas vaginalis (strain ATCC PRA-98 / G3) TaxID=412133 RepID=A2G6T5_TRIV3|nr:rRNA pseudouridine synthesis [Trichomonas vaginalis G3]EAX87138.1 ribosomal protein L7Ae, putative [Trichomonas vaginalis G3]KAI5546378.1 rRNA pseudouridine synthesis [Trichomonas vaginalis G3]|eukprot:XP_001300068.1 ribosomal protein L7Ae [Trichomonas vaginalis G3]
MGKHHTRTVPLIPIASPVAGHRLTKKIKELISTSCESKNLVYGVKDTKKLLQKNEKGLAVFGGNVTPMDVITHLPAMCENKKQPYVFLSTKEEISAAAQRTSAVACVVIREPKDADTKAKYDEIVSEINALNNPEPTEE